MTAHNHGEEKIIDEIHDGVNEYVQTLHLFLQNSDDQTVGKRLKELSLILSELGSRVGGSIQLLTDELETKQETLSQNNKDQELINRILKVCQKLFKVTIPL